MRQMTLIGAVKMHCAIPDESLSDFSQQYKKLTDEDKDWFRANFPAIGIEIVDRVLEPAQ